MLQVANICYRCNSKFHTKDLVFVSQADLFSDFELIKELCVGKTVCDDFSIVNIKIRKVEVLK